MKGYTGGYGAEWLTESAVKISEIFLKLTDTAEIQCHSDALLT